MHDALALALILALPIAAKAPKPDEAKQQAQMFQKKLTKDEQVLHALDRLTFGPRPGDMERVKKIGLKKWVDLQLHPERVKENAALEAQLQPLESLRMTPMEAVQHYPPPQLIKAIADGRQPMPEDPVLRATVERLIARYKSKKGLDTSGDGAELRQQLFNAAPGDVRGKLLVNAPQRVVAYDLLDSKLLRAIESNRQLSEELDDFWFNHFNVFYDKGADRFLIPAYERDAIRPNVLGKFRDLLEATAKSPAMLFYLDNFQSVSPDADAKNKNRKVKRGLNENYGRELMELHTLGVTGGYTQHDVTEVARCFTGWTILEPRRGGDFFYNDRLHDKGEKVVLGHVIAAGGGMNDGEQVLDILAMHPATARFISKELAQRFVADNPPDVLVEKMAQTFLVSNGDIREVMKTMLSAKEFWSQGAYRAKVKNPFEMVASSVRALNGTVTDAWALANQVGTLGEPLYRKQEPTGYSNLNSEWVSSAALLNRMNFALQLAKNGVSGVKVDVSRFQSASAAGLVIGSPDFQKR